MLKGIKLRSIFGVAVLGLSTSLTGFNAVKNSLVASAPEKPKIIASHNVICDLLTTIAEDTLDLTCLIAPGQDPHTYRPTTSERKVMEEAQVILYGGYQLEPKLIQLIEATETPAAKIAVYENAVTEPIMSEQEQHEGEHDEEQTAINTEELTPDPHVWHNVENVAKMVELIQSILIQLNPTNVEVYLKNSVALTDKLWKLDSWIKDQIATIPEGKKVLVTTHSSLNYYVQAYEFEDYQTLQGLSSEESNAASQLRELAIQVRQLGIPTIFAESTASDRVISNVAREAQVKLADRRLFADGLSNEDSYIDMMVSNTCTIVNGLGGECKPFH